VNQAPVWTVDDKAKRAIMAALAWPATAALVVVVAMIHPEILLPSFLVPALAGWFGGPIATLRLCSQARAAGGSQLTTAATVIGWIEISLDAVALVLVIWAIWSFATNPNPFPF
jgi:hypothetical protein